MNKPTTNIPKTDSHSGQAGLLAIPKTQKQAMMTGGADEASGFLINSLVSIQGDVRMQEPMAVQGAVTCQEMRKRVWKDFSLLLISRYVTTACSL